MKFGITFANAGPFAFPEHLQSLARTAEEVGIESIWTVEHVVVPVGYQSAYPYSETGKMPAPENVPISDPILPLAFAAAVTTKLRLATGVLILPQRHPVYLAKEMATLDVLSAGRAILGVGIGWLREEFEVVGVSFAQRGRRTEESIRAMRSLWKEAPEAFDGTFYRWAAVESQPKPVQKPGVPIVVGGHSDAGARRAARCGDGFFPASRDPQELERLLAVFREECVKIGRHPNEVEITTGDRHVDVDSVRRYRDLGVARLVISPPAFDVDGVRRGLQEFGDRVIARR